MTAKPSVVDVEDQNQMSPDALAICFNVTLCRPPSLASFNNMQQTLALVKHCIIHVCDQLYCADIPTLTSSIFLVSLYL